MNQPLAIVGASARAAAASAMRAGFTPITADLFADADLRSIATATRIAPYPAGFLDWLRTIDPPAWMYTGALENHPELVDQLAWIAPLWGNAGDVLSRVRSPVELGCMLSRAGLLFPETRDSADGLPRDGSWVVKTYRGAWQWSESTRREWETRRRGEGEIGEPNIACFVSPSPASHSPSLVYQRRIAGKPCAAVYVAADGSATLLGATEQIVGADWLGAHGFQFAGSIGLLTITESTTAELRLIGNTLARKFELVGLFGVDFILAGDRVWTIEVNPRYTASIEIVERCTGVSAIALHREACVEGGLKLAPAPAATCNRVHSKAILFARRDTTVTPIFAEWSLAEAARKPWPALADVSQAGTPIEAGRPVLTVFAEADNRDEVESILRQRVAEIEQRLYAPS